MNRKATKKGKTMRFTQYAVKNNNSGLLVDTGDIAEAKATGGRMWCDSIAYFDKVEKAQETADFMTSHTGTLHTVTEY